MQNLKKMTLEHRVFERMDVFLTNMGMRAVCFKRIDVFLIKYGHESSLFS